MNKKCNYHKNQVKFFPQKKFKCIDLEEIHEFSVDAGHILLECMILSSCSIVYSYFIQLCVLYFMIKNIKIINHLYTATYF